MVPNCVPTHPLQSQVSSLISLLCPSNVQPFPALDCQGTVRGKAPVGCLRGGMTCHSLLSSTLSGPPRCRAGSSACALLYETIPQTTPYAPPLPAIPPPASLTSQKVDLCPPLTHFVLVFFKGNKHKCHMTYCLSGCVSSDGFRNIQTV